MRRAIARGSGDRPVRDAVVEFCRAGGVEVDGPILMLAQLRVLGIESTVHKVPGELGDLHRVRIGPITDLAELNRLRARLRAADFDSMPLRIGD